jgi:signal transduction histidine kinase
MDNTANRLLADIERVKQIPIVDTMLEVICRSTGMGFAAVARVTEDRWIACSVRDEIAFGLQPGEELPIETTICNEIRHDNQPVIIDHVAESEAFCNHHTPKLYGFQSYISVPIVLQTGEFFGTLCAIDPQPALLTNVKTVGTFTLFAELISFHLHSLQLLEQKTQAMEDLNRQLADSKNENRQYKFISDHNLQEPLRKIRMFSSMLVHAAEVNDADGTRELAQKVNSTAEKFSVMIRDLSSYSQLNDAKTPFERVDLGLVVDQVRQQLSHELNAKQAVISVDPLPVIDAIPIQMEQLFYNLIQNSIRFSKAEAPLEIQIKAAIHAPAEPGGRYETHSSSSKSVEVRLQDNGIGIEETQLEKIFDIFSQLSHDSTLDNGGIGLSYCRKIVRNHKGSISAESAPGNGTVFSITLPIRQH